MAGKGKDKQSETLRPKPSLREKWKLGMSNTRDKDNEGLQIPIKQSQGKHVSPTSGTTNKHRDSLLAGRSNTDRSHGQQESSTMAARREIHSGKSQSSVTSAAGQHQKMLPLQTPNPRGGTWSEQPEPSAAAASQGRLAQAHGQQDRKNKQKAGQNIAAAAATQNGLADNTTCVSCLDLVSRLKVARSPCNHEYCRNCIETMFENVIENRTPFPVRCCGQPIPLSTAQPLLRPGFIPLYKQKEIESKTVDKTYCSNVRCTRFLHGNDIRNGKATCPTCKRVTCIKCKSIAHTGGCKADPGIAQVLELGKRNGWQQCYSCHQIVERIYGCPHIVCRCGAIFCYHCGKRWKTGGCEGHACPDKYARSLGEAARFIEGVSVGRAPANEEVLWPYRHQLGRPIEYGARFRGIEALGRAQPQVFEDLHHRAHRNMDRTDLAPEDKERLRRVAQNESTILERFSHRKALYPGEERRARFKDQHGWERQGRIRR